MVCQAMELAREAEQILVEELEALKADLENLDSSSDSSSSNSDADLTSDEDTTVIHQFDKSSQSIYIIALICLPPSQHLPFS